ncbi:HTH-type transcriptional activator IlvY [Zooshikella ganghwensis]|uniref:HTH-type transcriptional activator IlvY n=1 Tax=Zooshikella ganghwensis TaxID=202772 RepID=A0A4P9VQZ4_9GAMM|nr:HTH-type transcriptional activator IlvY [Zooshikella ganghwensis]RDH45998.1 HTH-type transcriptional activator IlvY [Zooshikella ganghwensis]
MDHHALRLFLHLANTLHFARTSQACHVSPSTLSRAIKRLEDEVGEVLFERDNRSVVLTVAGREFQAYAQQALQLWQEMQSRVHQQTMLLQGEVNLFCSVTASYSFLSELLMRFRQRYPSIEIKLRTGDAALALQKVQEGEEDLAIAAKPDQLSGNLNFKTIAHTPLQFIAPQQPGLVRDLTLQQSEIDWRTVPMIFAEQGLSRKRLKHWFRAKGIKPNIYAHVGGHEAIVSMVNLGLGVGVVPELVVVNSPASAKIRTLTVDPPLEPFAIGVCVQAKRLQDPLIKAFWDVACLSAE